MTEWKEFVDNWNWRNFNALVNANGYAIESNYSEIAAMHCDGIQSKYDVSF